MFALLSIGLIEPWVGFVLGFAPVYPVLVLEQLVLVQAEPVLGQVDPDLEQAALAALEVLDSDLHQPVVALVLVVALGIELELEAADLEEVVGIDLVEVDLVEVDLAEVVAVGIDLVEAVDIDLEVAVDIVLEGAADIDLEGAADIDPVVVAADIVLEEVVGIGLVLVGTAVVAAGMAAPVLEAFDLAGPDQVGIAGIAGRVVVHAVFVVGKLAGVGKRGIAAELDEFDAVHQGWAGHQHQPAKEDIHL